MSTSRTKDKNKRVILSDYQDARAYCGQMLLTVPSFLLTTALKAGIPPHDTGAGGRGQLAQRGEATSPRT